MPQGDVYFHSRFPFHDGDVGKKFFVVIYEPSEKSEEPFLVLKTTSNLREQTYKIGCNENRKAFFIPSNNSPVFPKDTLVQIQEIYEFSSDEFYTGTKIEKSIDFKEKLHDLLISQLINCVKKFRDDISVKHYKLITRKNS